jgi:hypothetical protein
MGDHISQASDFFITSSNSDSGNAGSLILKCLLMYSIMWFIYFFGLAPPPTIKRRGYPLKTNFNTNLPESTARRYGTYSRALNNL